MKTPEPWEFVLLALAVFRLSRLVGYDTITTGLRIRLTHMPAAPGTRYIGEGEPRPKLAELIYCPFCTGWWFALALYAGWLVWPRATLGVASILALSAVGGLVAKRLDP